jgi:hypothetical protein
MHLLHGSALAHVNEVKAMMLSSRPQNQSRQNLAQVTTSAISQNEQQLTKRSRLPTEAQYNVIAPFFCLIFKAYAQLQR